MIFSSIMYIVMFSFILGNIIFRAKCLLKSYYGKIPIHITSKLRKRIDKIINTRYGIGYKLRNMINLQMYNMTSNDVTGRWF